MLKAYESNEFMRRRYYALNNITHVELWDTGCGVDVTLCSAPNTGYHEAGPFTDAEAREYAARFAPELAVI